MEPGATQIKPVTPPEQPREEPPRSVGMSEPSSAFVLGQLSEKLSTIERTLAAKSATNSKPSTFLEILKILFGGWPALVLVFVIVFHEPLGEMMRAVVMKTQTAEEIGAWGLSLKSTLREEASKAGLGSLADTLPTLSPPAIQRLLRSDRELNTIVGYEDSTITGMVERIDFPDESILDQLAELEGKGLVIVSVGKNGDHEVEGVQNVRNFIAKYKQLHPGSLPKYSSNEGSSWQLDKSLRRDDVPFILWRLTDLGKKAVDVVVKSIAAVLTPKADPTPKPAK